jgi:pheromone shutdown protein TraB
MTTETQGRGRVTLLGTVHVSPDGGDLVRARIREHGPDVVAVELDPFLFRACRERRRPSLSGLYRNGATLRATLLFLLSTPRRPFGPDGTRPGDADMLPAVREAVAGGATVALVDRPTAVTVNRTAEELVSLSTVAALLRLLWSPRRRNEYVDRIAAFVDALVELGINSDGERRDLVSWYESLSQDETAALVSAFADAFPSYSRVVIRERDQYIAGRLHWLRDRGYDVVAVLGKGHVPGVAAYLAAPETLPETAVRAPPLLGSTSATRSVPPSESSLGSGR